MVRKSVPALLAFGALFTLAACGGSSGGAAKAGDGIKMGPGVTAKEIRVGILSDFSGPIAEAATAGSLGMEVLFDSVNDKGGVCGRKVVAVKGDTKYDVQQATQAYRAASRNVVMIGQLLGADAVVALKVNIARDDMPTISISINTATLKVKDVYVPMPVFEGELANGVVWAAKQAGASADHPVKLGMVTAADDYGKAYADAVESAAKAAPASRSSPARRSPSPTRTTPHRSVKLKKSARNAAGARWPDTDLPCQNC